MSSQVNHIHDGFNIKFGHFILSSSSCLPPTAKFLLVVSLANVIFSPITFPWHILNPFESMQPTRGIIRLLRKIDTLELNADRTQKVLYYCFLVFIAL